MHLVDFGIDNRKLASLIWLVIAFLWMLFNNDIRKSLLQVVKAVSHPKALTTLFLCSVYVSLIIFSLEHLGYWHLGMLADSIFWFIGTALVLVVNSNDMVDSEKFKIKLLQYFSLSIILDFFVNLYSFSFLTEMVILPLITLVFLLFAVANGNIKYKAVTSLTTVLLTIAGLFYLWRSSIGLYTDLPVINTFGTFENFLLIPILTLLFIPFLYVIVMTMGYGALFSRIQFFFKNDLSLQRSIKWKAVKTCNVNLKRLNIFSSSFYKTYV